PSAAGRVEAAGERSAGGSGTLSRDVVAHGIGGAGRDRFRRGTGGDELPRRTLSHGAAEYGTADHGERGDEPVDQAGGDCECEQEGARGSGRPEGPGDR